LWGAVSLAFVPSVPFGAPNLLQFLVGAPALIYFVATCRRPRLQVARAFTIAVIAYALTILPWTALAWSALGRPWEAFVVPQIASVCMAFVIPRRAAAGLVLIGLFAGESLFVYFCVRHLGMAPLAPLTEPFASLAFAGLGVLLFMSRRRRYELAQQHIHVESKLEALRRMAPLFATVRRDLEQQLATIAAEIAPPGARQPIDKTSRTMGRALQRLGELSHQLDGVVAAAPEHSCVEAERRLLDRDAQLGVTFVAAVGTAIAAGAMVMLRGQGIVPLAVFGAKMALDATLLGYLVATRHHPSRGRATWALVVLIGTALSVAAYNELVLLHAERPYTSLLGQKLIMLSLGLTAAGRFGMSCALIVVSGADALVVYFALQLGAHKDLIALSEPWACMVFMVLALCSRHLREQRRVASVRLLRAETEAEALHHRAVMFLALRDRLNSPLQTLVLGAGHADSQLPPASRERVRAAVTQLVALSRTLTDLDVLVTPHAHQRLFALSEPDALYLRR
jgi:hypothetical protein